MVILTGFSWLSLLLHDWISIIGIIIMRGMAMLVLCFLTVGCRIVIAS